ncbi:MAG: protein-disulfide reductase DsbD [Ignavibacteria bacterium]|nr:protein-disulfide reductase DsbD [Ignavibacteria bacterium]
MNISVSPLKKEFTVSENIKINLKADIQSGFHINANKVNDEDLIPTTLKIESDDFKVIKINWPSSHKFKFSFSETELDVYEGSINVGINLKANSKLEPGNYEVNGVFSYQACNDRACFAPKDIPFSVNIKIKEDTLKTDTAKKIIQDTLNLGDTTDRSEKKDTSDIITTLTENPKTTDVERKANPSNEIASYVEEKGLFLALIFVFLIGLALNLTPCVYPLIPITISYFGAQVSNSQGKKILIALIYVLGMSVTYSLLGLTAALTGGVFGSILQNPVVISILVLIFIALALSMFGLYEIRIPQGLMAIGGKNREGYIGTFVMGLTVGIIAAPCIGPLVLSLLVYVGQLGNPFLGFIMFFVLSLGLGFPYIFLAVFSSSITKLPRSGAWMEGVKVIFGLMMLGLALYTAQPLMGSKVYEIIFPVFLIFCGVYLILFDKKALTSPVYTKFKFIIAIISIIWGAIIIPNFSEESVAKGKYEWQMINTKPGIDASISSAGGKPTMIDFYADWCAQCKELDKYTYVDPRVIELGIRFNNIKVDLTKGNKEIEESFKIQGLPVVAFIRPDGKEIEDLRVTGFMNADEFLKVMQKALEN